MEVSLCPGAGSSPLPSLLCCRLTVAFVTAVNLGQGFPDWEAPRFVKDAAIDAINDNHNQVRRGATRRGSLPHARFLTPAVVFAVETVLSSPRPPDAAR